MIEYLLLPALYQKPNIDAHAAVQRELAHPRLPAVSKLVEAQNPLEQRVESPGGHGREYTLKQVKEELSRQYFDSRKVSLFVVHKDLQERGKALIYALGTFTPDELRPLADGIWKYKNNVLMLMAYTADALKHAREAIEQDTELASTGKITLDEVDKRALKKAPTYEELMRKVFDLASLDGEILVLMRSKGMAK